MASKKFEEMIVRAARVACVGEEQVEFEDSFNAWKDNCVKELDNASCLEDMVDTAMMILRDSLAFKSRFDFNESVVNQMTEYLETLRQIL